MGIITIPLLHILRLNDVEETEGFFSEDLIRAPPLIGVPLLALLVVLGVSVLLAVDEEAGVVGREVLVRPGLLSLNYLFIINILKPLCRLVRPTLVRESILEEYLLAQHYFALFRHHILHERTI